MTIRVLAPGMLSSVQDLGRRGCSALGVGNAGAMDGLSLRLANLLVGNDDAAPAIEMTLRGPRLQFTADTVFAIVGGEIAARAASDIVPLWRPVKVKAGTQIDFGALSCGARAYLAVRGGVQSARVLGSASVDINAALGRALVAGDELAVTASRFQNSDRVIDAPSWSLDPAPWFDGRGELPIALLRGEHFDQLDDDSSRRLFSSAFTVAPQSNRVGYRLQGARLALCAPCQLVSEGVMPGTLQLPPDGEPIALMAEAPTTGGYPRIAHVAAVDMPRLAQRRPGDTVRFVEMSLADAQTRYLRRERELAALRHNLSDRLNAWL